MAQVKILNKALIALVLNFAIVIMEVISLIMSFSNHGLQSFQFYTEDSNMFTLLSSLLFCVYVAASWRKGSINDNGKEYSMTPQWVHMMRFMSTCCLTVTFIVVITVLAPMAGPNGYEIMLLDGSMLFHHFLCPVVAIISFIFFEKEPKLERKHCLYALIPTLIYAVIVLGLNILRVMVGPYPFLHIYEQPLYMTFIWIVVIIGGAYLIAKAIRWLNLKV